MITKMLHTGFAVKDIESAISLYGKMGFNVYKRFEKPEPAAYFAFLKNGDGSVIELFEFTATNHPQIEFIKHHMAFASDDLEEDICKLEEAGCKLVIPITKGVTLTYAYLRDPSGNYLEIARDE